MIGYEIWKIIPSLPFFSVSSLGRVRAEPRRVRFVSKKGAEAWREKKGKMLTQFQNGGYPLVHLNVNGRRIARTVHTLVAEAFIGPRPPKYDVCHNDGSRTNNIPDNLRYDTRAENLADMRRQGRVNLQGAKLTPKEVKAIRKLYGKETALILGKKFGVARNTIYKVWSREHWSHIV